MTGSSTRRQFADVAAHASPECRSQFATIPSNASELLVRDTIYLHDPSVIWPIRSLERRRFFQNLLNRYYRQILYGCTNTQCQTPTCLSRQKRVSKGPFRPYTVLSARTLASFLASQDHPEKGLCPHKPVSLGESSVSGPQPARKDIKYAQNLRGDDSTSPRGPKLAQADQTRYYSPGKERLGAESPKLKAHAKNGHIQSSKGRHEQSDGKSDDNSRRHDHVRKDKDPKSFTQNLFDTTAMKLLQLAKIPLSRINSRSRDEDENKQEAQSEATEPVQDIRPRDLESEKPDPIPTFEKAVRPPEITPVDVVKPEILQDRSYEDGEQVLATTDKERNVTTPDTKSKASRDPAKSTSPQHQAPIFRDATAAEPRLKQQENARRTQAPDREEAGLQPYPQSLSHFTCWNILELMNTVVATSSDLHQEHLLLRSFGRTDNPLKSPTFLYGQSQLYEASLAYSTQSITYVLSNVEPLLRSFLLSEPINGPPKIVGSYGFHTIVDAFRILNMIDPHPASTIPSLWVSAGKLYVPGFSRPKAPASTTGPSTRGADLERISLTTHCSSEFSLDDLEACHIVKIILAALVAQVPRCSPDTWVAVRKLRASGTVAPALAVNESPKDQQSMRKLLATVHAFENDMSLSLMSRLVKAISSRNLMANSSHHRALKPIKGFKTVAWHPNIYALVLRNLTAVRALKVLAADTECQPTIKGGAIIDPSLDGPLDYQKMRPELNFCLLVLVEWLRSIILKEWDGSAEVSRCGAVGGAMEFLNYIYHNSSFDDIGPDVYRTPFLAERLDVKAMPPEWLNTQPAKGLVHVLSYPFLFPRSALISYFRAINYAAMSKVNSDSLVSAKLASEMTWPDPLTRLGEIRLHDRLKVTMDSCLVLEIRREDVLTDAMNQLWKRQERELLRPLKVRMGMEEGEEGVDHGGVQQEFFRVAMAEALNPDYGAFTTDTRTRISWFQPRSLEPLYKFELLGLLTSLAIYNGLTLPFNFPYALYLKLLDKPVKTIPDIEDGWPDLAKGLKSLRDWADGDVEDVFMRSYVFSMDVFGTAVDIDMAKAREKSLEDAGPSKDAHTDFESSSTLCPCRSNRSKRAQSTDTLQTLPYEPYNGGAKSTADCRLNYRLEQDRLSDLKARLEQSTLSSSEPTIPISTRSRNTSTSSQSPSMVTNANRHQYIADYITHLTDTSIAPQFDAFGRGFFTCIHPKSLRLFTAGSLKTLVEGLPSINVDGLKRATRYEGGYHPMHITILRFWNVVYGWPKEKVHQLLEFVTASDRLPVGGVERIAFVVQKNGEGDARLPTSLTCFGRLLLPEYTSSGKMKQGLEKAIENSRGFGQP